MEQGGPRSHDCAAVAGILPLNSNISSNISHNMEDESTEKGATTIVAAAEIEKLHGADIKEEPKNEEGVVFAVEAAASLKDEQNTTLKNENEKLRDELKRTNTTLAALCVLQVEMQSTADALSAELESKNSTIDDIDELQSENASLDELRSQKCLVSRGICCY